jgi:biopolymer transport protein ExbB/TolQ
MISPLAMLQHGGPMIYVILLACIAHLLALLAQVVLAKKFDLVPLLWAGVLCTLLLGFLGSIMGIMQAFEAVVHASPEMKQTMMASGFSIAMYTTAAAVLAAIPQTLLTGIVASIVRNARAGGAGTPA